MTELNFSKTSEQSLKQHQSNSLLFQTMKIETELFEKRLELLGLQHGVRLEAKVFFEMSSKSEQQPETKE